MVFYKQLILFFSVFALLTSTRAKGIKKEIEVALVSVFNESSVEASSMFGNYFMKGIQLSVDENKTDLEKKGIRLKFRKMDYKNSAQDVIRVSNDLIKSNSVAAIGFTYSSHALIGGQIIDGKIPLITPYATANRISKIGNYINQSCINNQKMSDLLFNLIKKQNKKNIHIIFVIDCSYCVDFKNSLVQYLEKEKIKYSVVGILSRDLTEDKLNSISKKIKHDKIDAVVVPNHEVDSGKIISSLIKNDIRADFYGGDSWSDLGGRTLKHLLKKHDGQAFFIAHWHQKLNNIFSKKFVKTFKDRHQEDPPISSLILAYNAMNLLIQSLVGCTTHSRKAVAKCIRNIKAYNSVLGKVDFRDGRTLGGGVILKYSKKHSNFDLL